MRIVTWNIRFGRDLDRAADVIGSHESLRNADAFLFQELDRSGADTIAESLGCGVFFVAASVHSRTGREFGNAIVSTWPITTTDIIELPHQSRLAGQPRIAITAVLAVENVLVTTCCAHTEIPSLGRSKRRAQVETMGASSSWWATKRAVVGGDFNTVSKRSIADLVERFQRRGFAHASAAATPTLRRGGRAFTLDHVFARGMPTIDSGVVRAPTVSDHDPVWVRLDLD